MTPAFGTLRVFDDAEALARDGARFVCGQAEAKSGGFALCLSGGSTPRPLYETLATPPLRERFPWSRTQFFFGDERFDNLGQAGPLEHLVELVKRQIDAVVGHPPLWEIVGPDPLRAVARTDHRLARAGALAR